MYGACLLNMNACKHGEINVQVDGFQLFVQQHRAQLENMQLPQQLWARAYSKITNQIFDSGNAWQLQLVQGSAGQYRQLSPLEDLPAGIDVWVVDHTWTTYAADVPKGLKTLPSLVARVRAMLSLDTDSTGSEDTATAADMAAEAAAAASAPASSSGDTWQRVGHQDWRTTCATFME